MKNTKDAKDLGNLGYTKVSKSKNEDGEVVETVTLGIMGDDV